MKSRKPTCLILSALLAGGTVSVRAQGTAFSYQGRLRDNAIPAAGPFDLRFALYDAPNQGGQIGPYITAENVAVANGLFCVVLDFGVNVFTGAERWLETSLRPGAETGAYTVLVPRRALTATPYALYAPNAGTAGTATSVPAANLTGTVPLARLPGELVINNQTDITLNGVFSGSGAGLTAVDADLLDGQHGVFYQNAANLNVGTLPDARLSSNATSGINAANAATSENTPNSIIKRDSAGNFLAGNVSGSFTGNGSALTMLNASTLTSGTIPDARLSANATSGIDAANAATSANTPDTIVKRGANGDFVAGNVSGNFAGNGSSLTTLNASALTSGTVADERLSVSANTAIDAANAATSANTPGTIVMRDSNGGFFAGNVTGAFSGDGSGLVNIPASSIVGAGGGGGTPSLPSGITLVSTLPNDANLLASGCALMMTIPAPPWVTGATVGSASARFGHSAVWDGKRMIIWGGRPAIAFGQLNSGASYVAEEDQWEAVSTVDAPVPRWGHTAVWSGSEMLVWGGNGATGRLNTGGRFQPDRQLWRAISASGAPGARSGHIAIWTGAQMFIWGGQNASGLLGDGGFYAPGADQWSGVTATEAPAARIGATAVWANDRVLIWGGEGENGSLNSGSQLRFYTGAPYWLAMTSDNAPSPRDEHSAIWTGDRMIVWGGHRAGVPFGDGSAYDPATDSWAPLPGVGAPVARFNHAAVWTGQEMLILGGSSSSGELASGAAYNPLTGVWRPLSASGNPLARTEATAIWTGTEVLVFGGRGQGMAVAPMQRLVPQPVWHFYRKL